MSQYDFFKRIKVEEGGRLSGIDEIIYNLILIKELLNCLPTPTPEPTPEPTETPCIKDNEDLYVYVKPTPTPTVKRIKIGKFN